MIENKQRPLVLLLSLVALLVVYGLMNETDIASLFMLVMLFVVLLSATLQISGEKKQRWPAFALALPALLSFLVYHFGPVHQAGILGYGLLAAFFCYTVVRLLSRVLASAAVDRDQIFLALSVYLLLGYIWFAVYSLVELVNPGSFHSTINPPGYLLNAGDRIYYSFEALTTLGMGDFVPFKPVARILTILEAATGVLYVGVLVARLVSSYAELRKK